MNFPKVLQSVNQAIANVRLRANRRLRFVVNCTWLTLLFVQCDRVEHLFILYRFFDSLHLKSVLSHKFICGILNQLANFLKTIHIDPAIVVLVDEHLIAVFRACNLALHGHLICLLKSVVQH